MKMHTNTDRAESGNDRHLSRDDCRDLLHGLLSVSETDEILSHVAGCSRCEILLQEMVAQRERLRAAPMLKSLVAGAFETGSAVQALRERETPLAGAGAFVSWVWEAFVAGLRQPRYAFATALAGAAIVLLVVLWPHQPWDPESAQLHWLPTLSGDVRLRDGAEAIGNDELAAGLEAYAAQDLPRAIDLLQRAEVSGELEMIRKVYLGSALTWQGRHQDALATLQTIAPEPLPDPWRTETLWTSYIALRESGHEASADSLLRVLAREPLEIGRRARRLLQSGKAD